MNIFEQASIQKLRFPSSRGDLTTEQLWDLPLRSRNDFNLGEVAKAVNRELNAQAEEDFVDSTTTPASGRLALMLEIVKHVINVKKEAQVSAEEAARRKEERERLMHLLSEKEMEELKSLSKEEIAERLKRVS